MTKQRVLSEIRRTAAENGGVPLGQQRFSAETGIRVSDWKGRYWARWGDAVTEAGFPKNQFNLALPEDELLVKLAELARELGHLPVEAELMLKAQADSELPDRDTFRRRLGKRPVLVAKLRDFCV